MAFNEAADGSPQTGQWQMLQASNDTTSSSYAIKVELNDQTSGSPQRNTTFYFLGQVGSFVHSVPGADEILRVSCEVRINSAIIKLARL